MIDAIISTNYDGILAGVFQQLSRREPIVNPLLGSGEWPEGGYYSPIAPLSQRPRLWQVHGSLDHLCFECCECVHRAPAQEWSAEPYACNRQSGAVFAKHFHDFNFPRSRFQHVINAAKTELRSIENIALVLVLGYKGERGSGDHSADWLSETLKDLADSSGCPVYLLMSPRSPIADGDESHILWNLLGPSGTKAQRAINQGGIASLLGEILRSSSLGSRFTSWLSWLEASSTREEDIP